MSNEPENAIITYRDGHDLAAQVARKIFPKLSDEMRCRELARLLIAFADEIKRSAIEP